MTKTVNITSFQMGLVLYIDTVTTGGLMLPYGVFELAKQDLWFSFLISSLFGYLMVLTVVILNNTFPGKTFIEIMKKEMGILGYVLSLCFLLFFLYITAYIFREYCNFIVTHFYRFTPQFVLIGIMVIVSAYAVKSGIEVICRTATFFFPLLFFSVSLSTLPLIPDMHVDFLLPMFPNGLIPGLKGSVIAMGWLSEFVFLSMFLPFVSARKKILHAGYISLTLTTLTIIFITLCDFFVLGQSFNKWFFPYVVSTRYVSLGRYFEHIEAIVMAIWIVGIFIKIASFSFMFAYVLKQFLGGPDYRSLVLPISFMSFFLSLWIFPSLTDFFQNGGSLTNTLDTVGTILFPLFILSFIFIKKLIKKS
ncbi:GerAB/ArcD/ProY family transporter [Terrilactibacillus laevilacticus]|uniref:Endospore germination permease n=1 Tax=Terrilactibacillus laevilacticus TaxID=1380157 RepID=A0ABW5PSB0_9BACI|nr:endospore germination permease [Terrilactibacillus laevilacticus]